MHGMMARDCIQSRPPTLLQCGSPTHLQCGSKQPSGLWALDGHYDPLARRYRGPVGHDCPSSARAAPTLHTLDLGT